MNKPTAYSAALATNNFGVNDMRFGNGYFDNSLMTIQMAVAVPMTPPANVPTGTSRPEDSSQRRPNQTDKPMVPAMVNAIPENRKNEPCGALRFGEDGVKLRD